MAKRRKKVQARKPASRNQRTAKPMRGAAVKLRRGPRRAETRFTVSISTRRISQGLRSYANTAI